MSSKTQRPILAFPAGPYQVCMNTKFNTSIQLYEGVRLIGLDYQTYKIRRKQIVKHHDWP